MNRFRRLDPFLIDAPLWWTIIGGGAVFLAGIVLLVIVTPLACLVIFTVCLYLSIRTSIRASVMAWRERRQNADLIALADALLSAVAEPFLYSTWAWSIHVRRMDLALNPSPRNALLLFARLRRSPQPCNH